MARPLPRPAVPTLLLALAAAGACGGADEPAGPTEAPAPATEPTATEPTVAAPVTAPISAPVTSSPMATPGVTAVEPATLIEFADDRLAFTLALPDEHALVDSGTDDFVGDGSCVGYWWQLAGGVLIEAWPASCDPENSEPGNGAYGHYRTLADAPAPTAGGAIETVLGPATLGEQVYYECTNACSEWPLDIAVIELSEPVDADYPTLAVISTGPEATLDDLRALLDAFGAG